MDKDNNLYKFGHRLKELRQKQNYTQDKFSALIDIDPRNLSRIEKGKSFPSFGTFCKIIEVLKIEPNYFLNFVQFNNVKEDKLNIELFELIKSLPNELKSKIIELIRMIKK